MSKKCRVRWRGMTDMEIKNCPRVRAAACPSPLCGPRKTHWMSRLWACCRRESASACLVPLLVSRRFGTSLESQKTSTPAWVFLPESGTVTLFRRSHRRPARFQVHFLSKKLARLKPSPGFDALLVWLNSACKPAFLDLALFLLLALELVGFGEAVSGLVVVDKAP
jgi:hypothetical protein